MGEVNLRVRLFNATDVEKAEQGLLDRSEVRQCEVDAVVDTGATRSVIPPEIAERLGLTILRQTRGILADGSKVSCGVSSGILFEIHDRKTLEDAFVMGGSVLIGQTVLESTDLLVDCANHTVISNPSHPEGPSFRL